METIGVSVFGTPITQGSRIERAKAAANNKNVDRKLDQLLQFVQSEEVAPRHTHVQPTIDQMVQISRSVKLAAVPSSHVLNTTYCFIYNATGDPITYVPSNPHKWQGHVAGRVPEIIQNGQWAFLKHVGTPEPNPEGSIGSAVYNIQNYSDTMIAWSNPIKTSMITKNTVYCQMNEPGYFNNDIDWNEMYHNVRDSGFEYDTDMEGFTTKVRIDPQGSTPRCFAEFYLNAP